MISTCKRLTTLPRPSAEGNSPTPSIGMNGADGYPVQPALTIKPKLIFCLALVLSGVCHAAIMKSNSMYYRMLILVMIIFVQGAAYAQTKITYDVTGLIDVADLLIIHGSNVQWHHPGSGAAVGRHSGGNVATTISATLDGVTKLNDFAWIPTWPKDTPAEIRCDAYSSVMNDLTPSLPSDNMAVEVSVLVGRGSASIKQFPAAMNGWTFIVRFADGYPGAALLSVHISVEIVSLNIVSLDSAHWQLQRLKNTPFFQLESAPGFRTSPEGRTVGTKQPVVSLNIVSLDSAHWQVQWPTNTASFQLESAPSLPTSPAGWTLVTNQPVANGEYFAVPIDVTEPQEFFRLNKLQF